METNDREIIFNRQFFIDLAKDAEFNVSHIRELSEVENHEIVVGDKLLDMLVEVQSQFELRSNMLQES